MPEIRFQVTDSQAALLRAVARTKALPETEISRRAWARGLFELGAEHGHLANELDPVSIAVSRPGALSDDTLGLIAEMATRPMTLLAIVAELTERGIPTARGGSWTPTTVSRAIERARARGLDQGTSAAGELAQEPEPEPKPVPAKRRGRQAAQEPESEPAPAKRRGRRAAQEPAKPRPSKVKASKGEISPAPRKARSKAPRRSKG
jgi:hypothetical protein